MVDPVAANLVKQADPIEDDGKIIGQDSRKAGED